MEPLQLRETIKDALGHELHAVLVPFVFDHIHKKLASYFDKDVGNYSPTRSRTAFVDQAIAIIHLNFQADNLRCGGCGGGEDEYREELRRWGQRWLGSAYAVVLLW